MKVIKAAALAVAASAVAVGTIAASHYSQATQSPAFDAGTRFGSHRSAPVTEVSATKLNLAPQSATVLGSNPIREDDPRWVCHTMGNRRCSVRIEVAAARLRLRPALILPGQWQAPAGPVLVEECFASYPTREHEVELMGCLTEPDPRRSDRRVMTLHQYHVNHVNHAARNGR